MKSNRSEIVTNSIAEFLGVKTAEVTPERTLVSLGMDSLDTVELAMTLEEEFDIDYVETDDLGPSTTVADVINRIIQLLDA